MRDRAKSRQGFTLLEVMVALAILGLGLTAILSAQAGAFASASHARNVSLATGLARCKMSEVEERLAGPAGYPELDEVDSGPCCDGDTTNNTQMRCSWKIEKPQFPEANFGELDLNSTLGGLGLPGIGASSAPGAPPAPGPSANPNGGLPDLSSVGGTGGIEAMVMSFVYPILKPIYEASTRRVTVTLSWREGIKDYSIELMQWVTNPQIGGAFTDEQAEAAGLNTAATGVGAGSLPGTGGIVPGGAGAGSPPTRR